MAKKNELTSQALASQEFRRLWAQIFESPIHLDSALSKLPSLIKSKLARLVPLILQKPISLGEALGIDIKEEEPWCLSSQQLAKWKPALLMAERILSKQESIEALRDKGPICLEDYSPQLVRQWNKDWGKEVAADLITSLGAVPALGLRAVNRLGPVGLLKELKMAGISGGEVSRVSPLGVRFSSYASVLGTPAFKEGYFEIQDEGSQMMALFALSPERFLEQLSDRPSSVLQKGPVPWEIPSSCSSRIVIDACAGAGGKTLAIADLLGGQGRVFAYDVSIKKLQGLKRRAARAGYTNIQAVPVLEGNEEALVSKFKASADVVLVDAPCTGWGVLRRNPDIKWRQDALSWERMPEIQLRLLSCYAGLVAPHGRLIYGVCTFSKAETKAVVEQFLERHPEFQSLGGGYLGPHVTDGFFMAAFERAGV